MADLSKTAIVDDATILASFWTNLYDALTGDTVYDNVNSLLGVGVYRAKIVTYFSTPHFYATITELEDSLGITPDAQDIGSGYIQFNKTGAFDTDKTFLSWSISDYDDPGGEPSLEIYLKRSTDNTIILDYYDSASHTPPEDSLTIFIEIIVYP